MHGGNVGRIRQKYIFRVSPKIYIKTFLLLKTLKYFPNKLCLVFVTLFLDFLCIHPLTFSSACLIRTQILILFTLLCQTGDKARKNLKKPKTIHCFVTML